MSEKRHFKNLINFDQCIQLKELHCKMGIESYPSLPEISFKRTTEKTIEHIEILPEEKQIDKQLSTEGIDLKFQEIIPEDGFLTYKGRKVVAYIRDQPHVSRVHYGVNPERRTSGYKYHLCNCKTLQDMSEKGRKTRYFVSKRSDGLFNVNCCSFGIKKTRLPVSMQLCKNCRRMLLQMKIQIHELSLEQFFEQNDSYIPKSIKRLETFKIVQDYSDDHKAIASAYKKESGYTCQVCALKCHKNKNLLHLHHINGNKSNNYPSNLKVVCVACHANEPFHKHLKKKYHHQITEILKLRKKQCIIDLKDI